MSSKNSSIGDQVLGATWADLRNQFKFAKFVLSGLRLETFEEALHKTYPTEFVPDTDIPVRHSGLVRYADNMDWEEIEDAFSLLQQDQHN